MLKSIFHLKIYNKILINTQTPVTIKGTDVSYDANSNTYYITNGYSSKLTVNFLEGTTFKEISAEAFANFVLPNPSFEEQKTISEYLDEKCAEIDSLISANNSTIEKLKEYRQSVIYEAVTGKIEV